MIRIIEKVKLIFNRSHDFRPCLGLKFSTFDAKFNRDSFWVVMIRYLSYRKLGTNKKISIAFYLKSPIFVAARDVNCGLNKWVQQS